MKICFMWVENFKNLENIAFNFCSEYQYYFDINYKVLSREAKIPLPDRLLEKHISDITGVLGGNGTGKTNLLELLCLATKAREDINSHFLLVYEDEGQVFYFDSTEQNDVIVSRDNIQADRKGYRLKKLNVIFFSNVYDGSYLDFGESITDISINNRTRPETIYNPKRKVNSQIIDDLRFIRSADFSLLDYPQPTRISVKIHKQFWDRYPSKHLSDSDKSIIRSMRNYFLYLKKVNTPLLEQVCVCIQFSLLTKLFSEFDVHERAAVKEKIASLEINPSYVPDDINDIILALSRETENKHPHITKLLETAAHLKCLLASADFLIASKLRNIHMGFILPVDDVNTSGIEITLELINYISSRESEWVGISSGQRAYVNLFSSIWNALQKQDNTSDTLICIDEGDLYLHPQLQLEFIDKLVKVLPQLSRRRIQIIITTHSPLLVTDLPGQCLIILTQDDQGYTRSRKGYRTFGGNIYDIYRNTFDLDNKRTGNLSQNYITRIIDILDKQKLTDSDVNELSSSLSVIGDRLLIHHIEKRLVTFNDTPTNGGDYND